VHVTGVVPIGKSLPEGGTHTTVTGGEHASLACTCHVTSWPVAEEMSAGQVMLGGAVSATATVKVHELPLPRLSVALQVTVVTPPGKTLPEGGVQTGVIGPSQLSTAEAL